MKRMSSSVEGQAACSPSGPAADTVDRALAGGALQPGRLGLPEASRPVRGAPDGASAQQRGSPGTVMQPSPRASLEVRPTSCFSSQCPCSHARRRFVNAIRSWSFAAGPSGVPDAAGAWPAAGTVGGWDGQHRDRRLDSAGPGQRPDAQGRPGGAVRRDARGPAGAVRRAGQSAGAGHSGPPRHALPGAGDTRGRTAPARLGKDITVEWFDAGHGSSDVEQSSQHQGRMLQFAQSVRQAQAEQTAT